MFGQPGLAYVYPIHAKHCFNIVTDQKESGCAVLVRALEPLEGIEAMEQRRGLTVRKRLTTGPACLCQAMAIDKSLSGSDLIDHPDIWVEQGEKVTGENTRVTERIGVTSAEELLMRFVVQGNPFVSGPARLR
jgi:DNA-3-methyladenine glycosylase